MPCPIITITSSWVTWVCSIHRTELVNNGQKVAASIDIVSEILIKEGKNYLKIATGKVAKGFYARDKVRAADAEYLYRAIAKYAIENGDNNEIAMILKTLGGPMEGITRLMAPIVYNQKGFKPKTGKQVVLEHLNPVSYIDIMMIAKYKFKQNIDIDKIFKDHVVAIIDKKLATDLNGNGLYEPDAGDYPDYNVSGEDSLARLYGDETLWWVFNDKGNIHTETEAEPLGLEIHAQAFGFTADNEVNDMTFYNYKIINK